RPPSGPPPSTPTEPSAGPPRPDATTPPNPPGTPSDWAGHHKSRTRSAEGWEQQIRTLPSAGSATGSGEERTGPDISAVSQLWQTPERQDQRTGTSQPSASSSRLP